MAADVGLPLAITVALAWAAALVILLHVIRQRRRLLAIPTAALAVATLAILHSLLDFPLQIPGYTIVVFSLLGAGIAQSFRRSGKRSDRGRASIESEIVASSPGQLSPVANRADRPAANRRWQIR